MAIEISAASPWVTELQIVEELYPNGDRRLAYFSALIGEVTVRDLELVRTAKGGFRAVAPAVSRRDRREAVFFRQPLAHALMDAALRVYRDKGGQHGAYAGQG